MIVNSSPGRNAVSIVLRYDDYGGPAPCVADQLVIAAALCNHLRFTFGVIPVWHGQPPGEPCVQELLPALRAGVIEMAQHGYTHEALWKWRGRSSEFSHMPFQDQLRRIAAGKEILEKAFGQKVSSFIPPWNRHDIATVACLEKLGFDTLSGDNRFPGWNTPRLRAIPATCGLQELKDVVSSAQARNLKNALVVCLFHRYDFRELDAKRGWLGFDEFNADMKWLAAQLDVETLTIAEASQRFPGISGSYQHKVCRWLTCDNLLPVSLRVPVHERCVYPAMEQIGELVRSAALKLAAFNLAVFAGAVAISLALSKFVHDNIHFLQSPGGAMCLTAMLLAAIYAFRDRAFTMRRMIVFAAATGAVLGWFGLNLFRV